MDKGQGLFSCLCDLEKYNNYPDIEIQIGNNVYTLPKRSYVQMVRPIHVLSLISDRQKVLLFDYDHGVPWRTRLMDPWRELPSELLYRLRPRLVESRLHWIYRLPRSAMEYYRLPHTSSCTNFRSIRSICDLWNVLLKERKIIKGPSWWYWSVQGTSWRCTREYGKPTQINNDSLGTIEKFVDCKRLHFEKEQFECCTIRRISRLCCKFSFKRGTWARSNGFSV